MSKNSKIEYLDGLRGLMAVNVLLCHFIAVYYPQMLYPHFSAPDSPLSAIARSPFAVLFCGEVAVFYFFVLTGFLVGRGVFLKNTSLVTAAKKSLMRYFRLLPTVACAILFTFIVMMLGLQNHLNILDKVADPGFLLAFCNFEPSFWNMLRDIFVSSFISTSTYIPPFWTIRYEFWGYIICLFAAVLFKDKRWRLPAYLVVLAVIAVFLEQNFFPFIYGLIIADLYCNKSDNALKKLYSSWYKSPWFLLVCFLAGTYFACCPFSFVGIHSIWEKLPLISPSILRGVGVAMVFYVLLHIPTLQGVLSKKPILFIGSISFEIYAFHMTLMTIIQTGLFSVFLSALPYDAAAILAFLCYFALIIPFAYLFHLVIAKLQFKFPKKNLKT